MRQSWVWFGKIPLWGGIWDKNAVGGILPNSSPSTSANRLGCAATVVPSPILLSLYLNAPLTHTQRYSLCLTLCSTFGTFLPETPSALCIQWHHSRPRVFAPSWIASVPPLLCATLKCCMQSRGPPRVLLGEGQSFLPSFCITSCV